MSRRAALVGAALALAATAGAFDNPVIRTPTCTHNNFRVLEAVLPSILARSLRASGNSEGLLAADYLDSHLGIEFRIAVDPSQRDEFGGRPSLGSNTMMSFSDAQQEIDIHHALLHLDGSDEDLIIRNPELLERTASRFWPSIVHETSHARTAAGSGRFVANAVIEDEYIAFERELFFVLEQFETDRGYLGIAAAGPCASDNAELIARFETFFPRYRELVKLKKPTAAERRELAVLTARTDALTARQKAVKLRCPVLEDPSGDMALLLALFARSTGLLETEIRETYERKGRLSIDDPELIGRARAQVEDDLRVFTPFLERHRVSPAAEAEPGGATAAAVYASTVRVADSKRKALAFWSDPQASDPAVADYKALLAGVRAEADRKRARYVLVLKPFLPVEPAPAPAKD